MRITALIIAAILLMLAGCGDSRPPQTGGAVTPIGLAASLGSIGSTLTWAGALGATIGLGLRIAVPLFVPALAPFLGIFGAVGVWAVASLAIGLGCQWLAGNLWLFGASVALSVAGVVYWHWRDLRCAWLRHRAQMARPCRDH